MKKGYWVVAWKSISDKSAFEAYNALAGPALQAAGARILTAGTSRVRAYEEGVQQRTIIIEFDSYDLALAARETAGYQKALQALGSSAERDFRIVEAG